MEVVVGDLVDPYTKARRELLSGNSKILSSYAGLFWFDDSCSSIEDVKGLVEFTDTDVRYRKTVLPDGSHATYRTKRFTQPRGRVELNDGVVTISIGQNCDDKVIEMVISFMGLNNYRDSLKVIRSPFWDKK